MILKLDRDEVTVLFGAPRPNEASLAKKQANQPRTRYSMRISTGEQSRAQGYTMAETRMTATSRM